MRQNRNSKYVWSKINLKKNIQLVFFCSFGYFMNYEKHFYVFQFYEQENCLLTFIKATRFDRFFPKLIRIPTKTEF